MGLKLTVFINDDPVIEYDRDMRLPGKQRQYLDKMDTDMDGGFELSGERIETPDDKDRAKFVAMTLVHSIEADNEPMIVATCAYLATRQASLKEVRANADGDNMMMDLVYDQGESVAFTPTIN